MGKISEWDKKEYESRSEAGKRIWAATKGMSKEEYEQFIGYGKEMQSLQAQAEADIAAAEAREEEIKQGGSRGEKIIALEKSAQKNPFSFFNKPLGESLEVGDPNINTDPSIVNTPPLDIAATKLPASNGTGGGTPPFQDPRIQTVFDPNKETYGSMFTGEEEQLT